jgi:hypothetical protein
MAGGEPRLGTDSIYMALYLALYHGTEKQHYQITWLQKREEMARIPQETLGFIASEVKTSG